MAASLEALYLPTPAGPRFCVLRRPGGAPRGAVLHAPAFAEEMNKSRRMVSLQAQALARAGWLVLVPDLFGCGDSPGTLDQARWASWREDLAACAGWLRGQVAGPLVLWGLRLGCPLALEAGRAAGAAGYLLWQPVASGEVFLNQFLRLKVAGEMLAGGKAAGGTKALREALGRGETLEIAGYGLSPALAGDIDALRLAAIPPGEAPVAWLELGGEAGTAVSPASTRVVEAWRGDGARVTTRALGGEAFWQTVEIALVPELLDASVAALEEWT